MEVGNTIDKVQQAIRDCEQRISLQCIGVGVSGGRDSLMLLHVLLALGIKTKAYHCNFQLRGEESERDMVHTIAICDQWGVECAVQRFDTQHYASRKGISIEMAARELRYGWFDAMLQSGELSGFALGHHRKDSVETVVLNMLRGTGIKGLLGIPKINGLYFRPIHVLCEREIEEYVSAHSISYVVDSTNAENVYKRNLVRNSVFPLFEEINTRALDHIYECSERLEGVNDIYNEYISDAIARVVVGKGDEIHLPLEALNGERHRSTLLYALLDEYGFSAEVVPSVVAHCDAPVSGKMFFAADYRLLVDRNSLIIKRREGNRGSYLLQRESREVAELGYVVELTKAQPAVQELKNRSALYADVSKLRFPLLIRRWEQGDRIQPFGMRGSKLVSDYFTDHHFTVFEKENVWLVADAEGEVIWIAGHRASEKIRIDGHTEMIYSIKRREE